MTIKDFVQEANKVANDSIKAKRIDGMLKTKKYLNIASKIDLSDKITSAALTKKDADGNEEFHINSVTKYILHVMTMVDLYTDLEVDFKNLLAEYDLLNENGLLEVILSQIGEKEIAECQMFLDMAWNDRIQNELSTHAFISKQVDRFGTLAGVTLSPVIASLTKTISELDDDKVKQIVEAVVTNK